jgi:hypothetical protein
VWGKTEYKPISDEDRELALSCYRLGHGSPISTGEFTKHPRCANGCETARKWGTKPCEGFCEWLPQKTASPIDAGERVKERCYHGLDDSCPNCDPVRFGTESPINAAKKKP